MYKEKKIVFVFINNHVFFLFIVYIIIAKKGRGISIEKERGGDLFPFLSIFQ